MPDDTLSHSFKNSCGTHTAADAHRDHTVLSVFSLEVSREGRGEFRAGAAERVAESDRAAVWIYARCVESGLLDYGEGLGGEGFIQFDDGNVAEGESGELERLWYRRDWAHAEFLGRDAAGCVGDESQQRF